MSLYLSVLVTGEIRGGLRRFVRTTRRSNPLEQWLIAVYKAFSERTLPVDRAMAMKGPLIKRLGLKLRLKNVMLMISR